MCSTAGRISSNLGGSITLVAASRLMWRLFGHGAVLVTISFYRVKMNELNYRLRMVF